VVSQGRSDNMAVHCDKNRPRFREAYYKALKLMEPMMEASAQTDRDRFESTNGSLQIGTQQAMHAADMVGGVHQREPRVLSDAGSFIATEHRTCLVYQGMSFGNGAGIIDDEVANSAFWYLMFATNVFQFCELLFQHTL
jgi:hypothetical protein